MYAAVSDRKPAYGDNALRTPRDTEYAAFSRVTSMLRQSLRCQDRTLEIKAVSSNNKLWTILATDLAHEDNALLPETRASLLSLALFSIRHGHAVLAEKATADALVDINMSIMKGLRGEVQP